MELKPVRTGDETVPAPYEQAPQVAITGDSQRVLRNTYLLLAVSLVPTAIGAAIGSNIDLTFMREGTMRP